MNTHVTKIRNIGPNLQHVTCSHGCELGSSAIQPTVEKAKGRAKLHELARSYYIATLEN